MTKQLRVCDGCGTELHIPEGNQATHYGLVITQSSKIKYNIPVYLQTTESTYIDLCQKCISNSKLTLL